MHRRWITASAPRRARAGAMLAAAMLLATPMHAPAVKPAEADAAQDAGAVSGHAVPVEGFMRLEGSIAVGADGRVTGYGLAQSGAVPAEVRTFVARQVAGWRVEFEDGVAPPAGPVPFSIRVRASPAGGGLYGLWMDGISLDEPLPPGHRLQAVHRHPAAYPRDMARVGASGIAYMLAKVGTDGRVEDVFAEQVDLTAMPDDPADIVRYQLEFMASAASAIRRWRFKVPAEGPYAGAPQVLRVPVAFVMHGHETAYGEWEYLVRGVRKPSPWRSGVDDPAAQGAIAPSGVQPARARMWVARAADPGGG